MNLSLRRLAGSSFLFIRIWVGFEESLCAALSLCDPRPPPDLPLSPQLCLLFRDGGNSGVPCPRRTPVQRPIAARGLAQA